MSLQLSARESHPTRDSPAQWADAGPQDCRRLRCQPADPYGGANQEIPIKPQPESSALPFSHRARTDELVHRSMRSLGFLLFGGLAAGCGWPVRTLTSCLVRMLAVQATKCGVCCPPFVNLSLPDGSVERAKCRSRCCFQRAGSVSSWVPPVGRESWGL